MIASLLLQLAPAPTAEKYGVPSNEKGEYNLAIRRIGCGLLFTCAIVWRLIFQDSTNDSSDRYTAFALATSVWFVEHLASVLNKEYSRRGKSDSPNIVTIVIDVVVIAGCMNATWAPFAAKAGVAALFFYGVGFIFFTKFFCCKIRQMDVSRFEDAVHGPYIEFVARAIGIVQIQSGVFAALLESGIDYVRAFGLSCTVLTLGLFYPFHKIHAARKHTKFTVPHVLMATGFATLTFLMLRGCQKDEDSKTASE